MTTVSIRRPPVSPGQRHFPPANEAAGLGKLLGKFRTRESAEQNLIDFKPRWSLGGACQADVFVPSDMAAIRDAAFKVEHARVQESEAWRSLVNLSMRSRPYGVVDVGRLTGSGLPALAQELGGSRQTWSNRLQRWEERGLAERYYDEGGRRHPPLGIVAIPVVHHAVYYVASARRERHNRESYGLMLPPWEALPIATAAVEQWVPLPFTAERAGVDGLRQQLGM